MRTGFPRTPHLLSAPATAVAALILLAAVPASAAHRARLSADLADHLVVGSQTVDGIIHGTQEEITSLVTRYNLRVKKTLKEGAVLRLTAGQLDALSNDDAVDHLSGDVRLQSSTLEVTAETIGADQVWGPGKGGNITGKNVTVAVIDSGMDLTHAAL